jgi:hypothetical protein
LDGIPDGGFFGIVENGGDHLLDVVFHLLVLDGPIGLVEVSDCCLKGVVDWSYHSMTVVVKAVDRAVAHSVQVIDKRFVVQFRFLGFFLGFIGEVLVVGEVVDGWSECEFSVFFGMSHSVGVWLGFLRDFHSLVVFGRVVCFQKIWALWCSIVDFEKVRAACGYVLGCVILVQEVMTES